MSTPKNDHSSIMLRLPDTVMRQLRERAAAEHVSESEFLATVVSSFLDDEDWMHDAIRVGQEEARAGKLLDFEAVNSELRGEIAARRRTRGG
jgi:predicted transcriptional regulator